MPKLGERVQFTPSAFLGEKGAGSGCGAIPRTVTGRVVYINARHRFYDIEFKCGNVMLRESFKF